MTDPVAVVGDLDVMQTAKRGRASRDTLRCVAIETFADRITEELFRTGKARKVPEDIARRALRKLEAVHAASRVTDLRVPPGNRFHALKGDRAGQHAIAVNDRWRICFRFEDGDSYDVEFCDCH